jgi:hypothetical protein
MTLVTPPRSPATDDDRELAQRVAELEALIEEARRRARRRRVRNVTALLVAAGAAVGGLIGFGGHGGGSAGTAALASGSDARAQTARLTLPLASFPLGTGPQAFAFEQRSPNVVYVAIAHARSGVEVYETTDGGRHWRSTGAHGTGWISDTISLTADARRSGTLYAGTDVAVYKTVDGGRSWRPASKGLFPPHGAKLPYGTPGTTHWNRNNGWVLDVAVDPLDSNVVYSGADGVRKSVDGGHTWKTVFLPYPTQNRGLVAVPEIAIARGRPESIYALASQDPLGRTVLSKSSDAGSTWHPILSFPKLTPDMWGSALAIDPQHPATVYAGVGRSLERTVDAGASWHPITAGLPTGFITALAVDPQRPGTIFVALHTGYGAGAIYETTDSGRTWNVAERGPQIYSLAIDPGRPETIWAGGSAVESRTQSAEPVILRSMDSGRTWAIAR